MLVCTLKTLKIEFFWKDSDSFLLRNYICGRAESFREKEKYLLNWQLTHELSVQKGGNYELESPI
jgi:hypothetical protein